MFFISTKNGDYEIEVKHLRLLPRQLARICLADYEYSGDIYAVPELEVIEYNDKPIRKSLLKIVEKAATYEAERLIRMDVHNFDEELECFRYLSSEYTSNKGVRYD